MWQLKLGNCKELIKDLEDNSIDSIVTDPPYELGFMGKKWDNSGIAYDVELWSECLRVLKHGGHLLAFSGSRTYHRMAVAIEDAGFEIRDQIQWVYGSGFPKSHNIGKALDKMQGAERIDAGEYKRPDGSNARTNAKVKAIWGTSDGNDQRRTKGHTQWDGWGTALKPAHEPICVARKPLIGTVAENVLKYGTGGINIDGCRVATDDTWQRLRGSNVGLDGNFLKGKKEIPRSSQTLGRWPANFIHDGSEEVLAGFPETGAGAIPKGTFNKSSSNGIYGQYGFTANKERIQYPSGSASRFFYCAKASKKDRDEGCEGLDAKHSGTYAQDEWSKNNMGNTPDAIRMPRHNHHPTVKPTDLMRYLCRLVTPPNGIILDPFTGSGSTGKAAILEGFRFLGFDMQSEYIDIASARIKDAEKQMNSKLF